MTQPLAIVFGAGKIARGFVGHLLFLSGYRTLFVDVSPQLVSELSFRGRYSVNIMGAPERSSVVTSVDATLPDSAELLRASSEADIIFVSVGGNNLGAVAPAIARVLHERAAQGAAPINIVLCENWIDAAKTLNESLIAVSQGFSYKLGRFSLVESTVLRSSVDPSDEERAIDPLAVRTQNHWTLPVDGDALLPGFPPIQGLEPVTGFSTALTRKLFTYNMGNATLSFLGAVAGYRLLSEAANDPNIVAVAELAYEQVGLAMVAEYGFDPAEQRQFAAASLAKFQSREIEDPIQRQIKDPIRKLGRNDRLVGPALLCLKYGILPTALAQAIAAALTYRSDDDPIAAKLAAQVDEFGALGAFCAIAGIGPDHQLARLVSGALVSAGAVSRKV